MDGGVVVFERGECGGWGGGDVGGEGGVDFVLMVEVDELKVCSREVGFPGGCYPGDVGGEALDLDESGVEVGELGLEGLVVV